jgi:hypothetical protein
MRLPINGDIELLMKQGPPVSPLLETDKTHNSNPQTEIKPNIPGKRNNKGSLRIRSVAKQYL